MERVDVAVVGGGPAGTSAGEAAATAGADTVVIEKGVPRADRAELGPDSTDAAGMLDYWVDILGIPFEEIPDHVIHRELERTDFYGPSEQCSLRSTGISASYPKFGFTFDRTAMDDWLRERAESAGARYRVGTSVREVTTDPDGDPIHRVELADGDSIGADHLILADGPQRTVTMRVLDQWMPDSTPVTEVLGPPRANHIAYQEHRRFPEAVFEPEALKFWWGNIPGETAYPWVFPNDGTVARVGLTMPIGLTMDDIDRPTSYPLIDESDERLPDGATYLRRLLEREYGDRYDIEADFPLVADRGKRGGVESYPISSTRPIDSPTAANVAVVGGAMGTTSAFHEGGYHVAVRSGRIAGRLAGTEQLSKYNDAWKRAIGDELLRNVAIASLVKSYGPADWDRAIRITRRMLAQEQGSGVRNRRIFAGVGAMKLLIAYRWAKFGFRDHSYVKFEEDDYVFRG